MRRFSPWWITLFLACGPSGEDLCDDKCDCEGCSDVLYDDCVREHEADERNAEFRGCEDFYDEWLDCQEATAVCVGADWKTSCGPEHERYKSCVK